VTAADFAAETICAEMFARLISKDPANKNNWRALSLLDPSMSVPVAMVAWREIVDVAFEGVRCRIHTHTPQGMDS